MRDEFIRFRNYKNRVAFRFRVRCVSAFIVIVVDVLVAVAVVFVSALARIYCYGVVCLSVG